MPLRYIIHPLTGEMLIPEEAPGILEEEGVMPAEAVQAVVEDRSGGGPVWPYLSPSYCIPENTCRRKLLMQRTLECDINPMSYEGANEGTAWHDFMEKQPTLEGWHKEVWLPDQDGADDSHPQVRVIEHKGRKVRQLEFFPGLWMRTRIDRASPDWSRLYNHKTSRWPKGYYDEKKGRVPKTDYGDRDARGSWAVQGNLERRAVELLRGTKVEELWVWRKYRGSQILRFSYRKFPVQVWTDDRLWGEIQEFVQGLLPVLQLASETEHEEDFLKLAKSLPMDGKDKNMFNGWLCRDGCPFREQCYGLQGFVLF